MHINIGKLHDYSKKKTYEDVLNDIVYKYQITNILQDDDNEALSCIVEQLYDDYFLERANYEAYIEKGMDARVFMELRKSATILMDKSLYDFYRLHDNCKTVLDIKKHRCKYLKFLNDDYVDADWQYYYLMITGLGYKKTDFRFDFEDCYADGNPDLMYTPDKYKHEFYEAFMFGTHGSGAVE